MHEMMGGRALRVNPRRARVSVPHLAFRPAPHTRERFLLPGLAVPSGASYAQPQNARTVTVLNEGEREMAASTTASGRDDARVRGSGLQRGGQPPAPARRPRGRPELFAGGGRLIVVDDGSTDGTRELVAAYAGRLPLELVRLERNQGPGAAFAPASPRRSRTAPRRRAHRHARGDTTSDLDALPAMLERAHDGADLVLADWRMVNVGRRRRLLSHGGRLRRPPRARPERQDRLLVLPRLPRVGAPARLRPLRRRLRSARPASPARPRSWRSSSRTRHPRRRGARRARLEPPRSARARCRSLRTMLAYGRMLIRQRVAGARRRRERARASASSAAASSA